MNSMKQNKRETRYYEADGKPRLREGDEASGRTIEGYAIVFGVPSKLLSEWGEIFREVIEQGSITLADLNKFDIKMTLWHNREKLLARSDKGKGTLKLSIDKKGVKYEFESPNTPDGDTALELVKRGDLAGSSFIYFAQESSVNYYKDAEGVLIRSVKKIDAIYDMTIASDPAYNQTNVSAREVEKYISSSRKMDEISREDEIQRIREAANKEITY